MIFGKAFKQRDFDQKREVLSTKDTKKIARKDTKDKNPLVRVGQNVNLKLFYVN